MLNTMSSSQFAEWQDFLAEEPLLDGRLFDRQIAQFASMYYNRHRPQSSSSVDMTDFCMLATNRQSLKPQSAEQMYQMMKGVQIVQNSRSDLYAEGEC